MTRKSKLFELFRIKIVIEEEQGESKTRRGH